MAAAATAAALPSPTHSDLQKDANRKHTTRSHWLRLAARPFINTPRRAAARVGAEIQFSSIRGAHRTKGRLFYESLSRNTIETRTMLKRTALRQDALFLNGIAFFTSCVTSLFELSKRLEDLPRTAAWVRLDRRRLGYPSLGKARLGYNVVYVSQG